MRKIDRRPIFLILSILSFYVSSFSIAFMPLGTYQTGDSGQTLTNVLALVFWLGIAAGLAFTFRVRKQRKWDIRYKPRKRVLPHVFRFFSNKPAKVFDSLLITGALVLVITYNTHVIPGWLVWEFLFITVFSLEMHCVFNGKNYEWLYTHK